MTLHGEVWIAMIRPTCCGQHSQDYRVELVTACALSDALAEIALEFRCRLLSRAEREGRAE